MISVIIPLYNKERQIRATLESVLRQSYTDFEIIVVDDGSTDGSAAVVESFQDARLRLIRQENGGVSAARNRGIREAKGEDIAFLDADDLWEPEFLKTLHQLSVQYPSCSVYACNYDFVSPDGTHRPTIIRRLPFMGEHGILSNYFEVASCSHPPLWTSALMVRKEAMQAIGGFPLGIKSGEDLLTWARLACRFKIAYTKTIKAHYEITQSSAPKRMPEVPDVVGEELRKLFMEYPEITHLKHYCALWHKMRTWCYMKSGDIVSCAAEARRSLLYRLNWKPIAMVCFSVFYNFFVHSK